MGLSILVLLPVIQNPSNSLRETETSLEIFSIIISVFLDAEIALYYAVSVT